MIIIRSGGGSSSSSSSIDLSYQHQHQYAASPTALRPSIWAMVCLCMLCTLLDLCVSSLRRGHANLLCIVPILTDDPRRESMVCLWMLSLFSVSSALASGIKYDNIL